MKTFVYIISLILCFNVAFAASIPENAKKYHDVAKGVIDTNWNTMPLRETIGGQVERESDWKPTAQLKTSREHGMGLTQITIAYDSNGKERFNNFKNAVAIKQLKNWNWRKDPYNVKYQLTYLVLQDKSNFNMVRKYMINDEEAMKTTLVCYNAGEGRWLMRRTVAKAKGIPSDRWTGGLDHAYTKGETEDLYVEPLWKAVNEYPILIFGLSKKYIDFYK